MSGNMVSVAIIARDEERHLAEALRSAAAIASEQLFLFDRGRPTVLLILRRLWRNDQLEPFRSHAAQRNRALQLCRQPWVLFLDADERLTPELAAEIGRLPLDTASVDQPAGYWIPRYNLYWGRRLRGGGWYPDRQLRLLRRDAAHFDERRLIHEYAELTGPAGQLSGHLLHINIEALAELRHNNMPMRSRKPKRCMRKERGRDPATCCFSPCVRQSGAFGPGMAIAMAGLAFFWRRPWAIMSLLSIFIC